MRLSPLELDIGDEEGFTPEKDIFGRKRFGETLTRIVRTLEGPAVLLLDAPWGTGKTTFVKMWRGELAKAAIPSIYFDAFASDYHEDAFITLAGEIIARAEEVKPHSRKVLNTFKHRAVGVAKVLGRASLRFGIRAASTGLLSGEMIEDGVNAAAEIAKAAGDEGAKGLDELLAERLESHNADRDAFEHFRGSFNELSDSLATSLSVKKSVPVQKDDTNQARPPLVFIIDELDRCRPPFALEFLEKSNAFL